MLFSDVRGSSLRAASSAAFAAAVILLGAGGAFAERSEPSERVVCDPAFEQAIIAEFVAASARDPIAATALPPPPYVRNRRVECVEASDINGKLDAYPLIGSPRDAYKSVLACMFRQRCYFPNFGTIASPECLKELCTCNQAVVHVPISCGPMGLTCAEIKEKLARGGTVVLGLRDSPFGSSGHAIQVVKAECTDDKNGELTIRDPNAPEKELELELNDGVVLNPNSNLHGWSTTEAYGTEPNF